MLVGPPGYKAIRSCPNVSIKNFGTEALYVDAFEFLEQLWPIILDDDTTTPQPQIDVVSWECDATISNPCTATTRETYGWHTIYIPPSTLTATQAEIYSVLRSDGMRMTDAHQAAQLL